MWTYDLTEYLMVYFKTIIALASMTYLVNLDTYELHPHDKKEAFNNFIDECYGFTLSI